MLIESVHCREEGCIGKYTPEAQEISQGRGFCDWYQSTHRSYCQPKVNSQKSVNVDFDWYKSTHRSYCQPKVNFQK